MLEYEALRERSGAQALKDVLSEAMQAFATSFDGVDDRVIACLKQNTYLFVADGASDEQLCGRPKNQLHKVCKEQNIWNSKTIHDRSNKWSMTKGPMAKQLQDLRERHQR